MNYSFKKMLSLNHEFYIGEGEIRKCYQHPDKELLCIKIPRKHVTREYTFKEILYFKKLSRRDKSGYKYPFYSDFHGEIKTSIGDGQVFDLIKDETTGKTSKTLEFYLQESTAISDDKLWKALQELKTQMTIHKVFTRDLRSRNLCCKILKNNSVQIIIIDGIGHRDFFPLADIFHYFSKKKIDRTFEKWHFTSLNNQRVFLSK